MLRTARGKPGGSEFDADKMDCLLTIRLIQRNRVPEGTTSNFWHLTLCTLLSSQGSDALVHSPWGSAPRQLLYVSHFPVRVNSTRRAESRSRRTSTGSWQPIQATRSGATVKSASAGAGSLFGLARGNPFRLHAPERLSSRRPREPARCQPGSWQPVKATRSEATVKSASARAGSLSARLVATCSGYTLRSDCQIGSCCTGLAISPARGNLSRLHAPERLSSRCLARSAAADRALRTFIVEVVCHRTRVSASTRKRGRSAGGGPS